MIMKKLIIIVALFTCALTVRAQVFADNGHQWIFTNQVQGDTVLYSASFTPSSPLSYTNQSNLVIENLSFTSSPSTAIWMQECSNIRIRHCKFKGFPHTAIGAENPVGLVIENCIFDSIGDGILISTNSAHTFNGGFSTNVKVSHNYFRNTMGGWPRHHCVMFAGLTPSTGSLINFNSFENIHLQSFVDDMVSLYQAYGSVSDSIQVIGNWFRGGDWNDANHTGSGITFGDNGGSYIHIKNNILVNTVSGAIGNAGANNTTVEYNKIYQSQELANPSNWADGYIMKNFTSGSDSTACYANTWQYNNGLYYTNNGSDATYRALSYAGNGCTKATGTATNTVDYSLSSAILPNKINIYHY